VRIVGAVCRLWVFRLSFFPRPCLRESLALFHVLRRMGRPAHFHLGVRKYGEALRAHSWITCESLSVGTDGRSRYRTLYSYPHGRPS
jgi:hypothetical protein